MSRLTVSIFTLVALASCSGGGFTGLVPQKQQSNVDVPKKNVDKTSEYKPYQPISNAGNTNEKVQPLQPIVVPEKPTPANPVLPPVPQNPVLPKPTPEPTPVPESSPLPDANIKGIVTFVVLAITNQATKYHVALDGSRFQIQSMSGELLASGDLNMKSIVNGYPVDKKNSGIGRNYALRSEWKYISSNAGSGEKQVKFTVCLPQNVKAPYNTFAACRSIQNQGHSNGVNQIRTTTARAVFAPNKIDITSFNLVDSYGSVPGAVALAHAAAAAFGIPGAGDVDPDPGSPLVLDLSSKGKLNLVDVWNDKTPVKFDITASGQQTRTGWIGKDAGLLALDIDGDGKINNGKELFGNFTTPKKGKAKSNRTFDNGFLALAQYDEKNLGYLDASNPTFDKLVVWTDVNTNGISENGELHSLKELGITRINTTFESVKDEKKKNIYGNKLEFVSTFVRNGKIELIGDVYFELRQGVPMKDVFTAQPAAQKKQEKKS